MFISPVTWGDRPIFGARSNPIAVVESYIAALNARDAEAIDTLLADDCRLVDSTGGWVEGRENAMKATRAFFEFETDFRIDDQTIVLRGDEVLVRGSASANNPQLAKDSLWQARVRDGKLAYWQSFGAQALPLAQILLPEKANIPEQELQQTPSSRHS